MPKKNILITVKTYPSISTEYYEELVCTAGIDENGSWFRIYPVPFRKLDYSKQYKKYQWIEVDLIKNTSDFRPESFRLVDIDKEDLIAFHNKLDTKNNWAERKKFVLKNVYYDIEKLKADSKNAEKYTSLAVFKPTSITNFTIRPAYREWTTKQKAVLQQKKLYETNNELDVVKRLPFKFSYAFKDINGKECTLMNEDWEVGALYWNCLKENGGDEKLACEDVKKKYWDDLALTKDLYFFLGTTKIHHLRAPNPFIIIGTFYPKKEQQLSLF